MNNNYYIRNKDNVIAFPQKNPRVDHNFPERLISQFIRALVQNNLVLVQQLLIEHGSHLAMIEGNYFCPPLLIASKQNHLEMVNLLLENGACAKQAMKDPRAKYISNKMKKYLTSIHQFGHSIWNKIDNK